MRIMVQEEQKKLDYKDYTVGWVAVLGYEVDAARLLLKEVHQDLPRLEHDNNSYILGEMNRHNVVICFPPAGTYGTNTIGNAVANTIRTFPNIRFGLLVGVGGGVPRAPDERYSEKDIRLGDVVVSEPRGNHGGVIQYDMGKWKSDEEFSVESHLNKPPGILLSAVQRLKSNQNFGKGEMSSFVKEALKTALGYPGLKQFYYPGRSEDRLYCSDYPHPKEALNCSKCAPDRTVLRLARDDDTPRVHYGLIASANAVVKSAAHRDKLRDQFDIACFEMEAAGLMDSFPCAVIRGICDYSDAHKNKEWQPYAAIAAACYAKDLLGVIPPEDIKDVPPAADVTKPNKTPNDPSVSLEQYNQLKEELDKIKSQLQQSPAPQTPSPTYPPTPLLSPQTPNFGQPRPGALPYHERIGHFLKKEIDTAISSDRSNFERELRALVSRTGQTDCNWIPLIKDISVFKDTWQITEPRMEKKRMSGSLMREGWMLRRMDKSLTGQQRYFALCNEFSGWLNIQGGWSGEWGECSVEHNLWSLWRVMEYMGIAEESAVVVR